MLEGLLMMLFEKTRKEDLDLFGNQLNYMVAAWTAGYVIGEVPSNMIMTRVRPSIWIPSLEVGVSRCITKRGLIWHVRLFGLF